MAKVKTTRQILNKLIRELNDQELEEVRRSLLDVSAWSQDESTQDRIQHMVLTRTDADIKVERVSEIFNLLDYPH